MSDVQGGSAAVVETTPQAAPEAASSSQQERNWDTEARELGWVPKEEFKGPTDKWRDAETFVRRGEELLPIVRKHNKELSDKVKELEETNQRMARHFEQTARRERDEAQREIAALKAQRTEAVKRADVAAVDRIDAQIDDAKERAAEPPKQESKSGSRPQAGSKEQADLVRSFAKDNPWYVEEPEMGEYAEKFSQRNADANPDITFEDNAAATIAAVRRKFPDYFKDSTTRTAAAANGHAAVDGGGDFAGARPAPESYGLNAIERGQAEKDMKAFPKQFPTLKAWVTSYRGA